MLTSAGPEGRHCKRCNAARLRSGPTAAAAPAPRLTDAEIERVLLTTEVSSDLAITERLEIVTAECAFGMHIFKDLFAEVRDIVGGRSAAVQKTMRESRRVVLFELKREARLIGADAVVGVDLDYVELSAMKSMVLLVASGTAVRLDRS
ncbi:YbjQ family protein [Pelagovum pacificum]|nr:YbjQ family protein [Pelagovum pacificum]